MKLQSPRAVGETGKSSKCEKAVVSRHSSFSPGIETANIKRDQRVARQGSAVAVFHIFPPPEQVKQFCAADTHDMKTAIVDVKKMSHRCGEFVK
jgi:hypothetical protein